MADRDRVALRSASLGCAGTTTVNNMTHTATHETPNSPDPPWYMIGAVMSWYSDAAIP
jgi:hypothetical protein